MKVKYYLAALIITSLIGGYVIEYVLVNQHNNIQKLYKQHNNSLLILKDYDRLQADIAQYLITVDLILGAGESYLLDGGIQKGNLIIEQIDNLLQYPLLSASKEELDTSKNILFNINKLLISAYDFIGNDRQAKLNDLLWQSDGFSNELVKLIEDMVSQASYISKDTATLLNNKSQQISILKYSITGLFSVIILCFWYWANRQISRPLSELTEMANRVESGMAFTGIERGPQEVIELSKCLTTLTGSLTYQARHDPLTSLYNRRELERQLMAVIYEANHHPDISNTIVCYIDLDLFKTVNDTCGHAAGDELLVIVAKLLKANVREADVVTRIGGDEFCILLIGCDLEVGLRISHKIRSAIENLRFHWENEVFRISASIGLTQISDAAESAQSVLNAADAACRMAKESGRNNVNVFDLDDKVFMLKRQEMLQVNQLNLAIDEGRFVLFHQDIVPLVSSQEGAKHYEILVRMLSKDGEIINPGAFLPLIERYHLGVRLDQLVVNSVIEWLSANPEELEVLELCSINLSGQSIGNDDLREFVSGKLKQFNIPCRKICFEITETAAIVNIDKALIFIEEMAALGCRFALDDFGSGASSFGYLKNLPVDFIKIDGSFIKDILSDRVDKATVQSIKEVAKACGKLTIAEFVESELVAKELRSMGIDYAQGYYYGKPRLLVNTCPIDSNKSIVAA